MMSYIKSIVIVLMTFINTASATWGLGLYEASGSWYSWNASCKTWTNSTSWLTWEDNMYMDTSTGLCKFCPYYQFYESTSEVWTNWNGKCTKYWLYQTTCFQWSGNQYYDLELLKWVSACDSSKISVNSTLFQGIPIWKSFNIYVDPTSSSLIEFGTIDYPYKNLLLAFIEVRNLHSHTNRTINVYVKTGTTWYITPSAIYIINISKVNLQSYSDYSASSLRPKIISVVSGVTLNSPKSLFNIISNTTLNITALISNPILTDREQRAIQTSFVGFIIDRWDFTMSGIDFTTQHNDVTKSYILFKVIYQQNKTISLSNINIAKQFL